MNVLYPFRRSFRTIQLLSLLCISTFGFAQPAQKNTSLVGQLSFPHELNDVWGYADPNGVEYALVGLTDGVSIVSLADPTQPTEAHFIPGIASVWRDLKTFGHHAYVTNESDSGLLIIDLQYLPDSIVYRDTVMAGIETAHNLWIDETGLLYLIGTNNFNGGVVIFDLNANPWEPLFQGYYDDQYVHDMYARNGRAYLGEIYTGTLAILNVDNPNDPFIIGAETYQDGFTHNTWLNDAGDVCFTTDEYNGAYVIAWDVSDPSNIQELDRVRSSLSGGAAAPHNVHVRDDFLITSHYRDGLHLVDASRPDILVEVGYYDSSPLENGGFAGAWGAYPFLPSGLVLISDIEEGLFVVEVDLRRAGFIEGVVRDQETTFSLDGVAVKILDTLDQTISDFSGNYGVGVADSGEYALAFSKYGYLPDTILTTVDNEETINLPADLVPLPRVNYRIEVLEAGSMTPIEGAQVQAEVLGEGVRFDYLSDLDGLIQEPRFVIDSYRIVVGKWGYITQERLVSADSSQPILTFLLTPGYYDDFALDFGWTVEGNPRNGSWERGEPVGTYETLLGLGIFNPEYDLPNDISDQAYVTGNDGGSPFGDDVDRDFTRLVSPPIDLRLYEHPRINYYWWFVNWSLLGGGRPANDFFSVSLTDGIDTFEVRRYIGPFDTTWNQSEVRVEQYFPPDREIRVLFYTQDFEPGNQDGVEAALDGFRVMEGYPLAEEEPLEMQPAFSVYAPLGEEQILLKETSISSPYREPRSIELLDLSGKNLGTYSWPTNQKEMRLTFPHPPGLYLVRVRTASATWVDKFLIL